jgi:hypothetical protein
MLRELIVEMSVFAQTGSGRQEIERLAARHRELQVTALWLDALCEALAAHDSEFAADLQRMWREAMQGIDLMRPDALETDKGRYIDPGDLARRANWCCYASRIPPYGSLDRILQQSG